MNLSVTHNSVTIWKVANCELGCDGLECNELKYEVIGSDELKCDILERKVLEGSEGRVEA